MSRTKISVSRIALAAVAGVACLFVSERVSLTEPGSLISSAHAVIGRPLTPMSYAGVARRSAVGVGVGVGVGVAVGAAAARPVVVVPAPVVVAPVCAQVVNVYGQITTVCR
jgi:hypothetical protein